MNCEDFDGKVYFDGIETDIPCKCCGVFDEIDKNGEYWTLLDAETKLCETCFYEREPEEEGCPYCARGCNHCLMTSY